MRKYLSKFSKDFIIFPLLISIFICICAFFIFKPFSDYVSLLFSDKSFSEQEDINFDISEFEPLNTGTVSLSPSDFPKYGNLIGRIKINGTGVDTNLYFGDGDEALNNGAGISTGSFIPGYGKTILVGGHNHTVFNGLKNVQIGDEVEINTFYGNYIYKIVDTKVLSDTDSSAYDLSSKEENLIMYTCYPFDTLGITSKRLFVYATPVSGPKIEQ